MFIFLIHCPFSHHAYIAIKLNLQFDKSLNSVSQLTIYQLLISHLQLVKSVSDSAETTYDLHRVLLYIIQF